MPDNIDMRPNKQTEAEPQKAAPPRTPVQIAEECLWAYAEAQSKLDDAQTRTFFTRDGRLYFGDPVDRPQYNHRTSTITDAEGDLENLARGLNDLLAPFKHQEAEAAKRKMVAAKKAIATLLPDA